MCPLLRRGRDRKRQGEKHHGAKRRLWAAALLQVGTLPSRKTKLSIFLLMKSQILRSRLLGGVALVAVTTFAVPLVAGPGPQYWSNPGKANDTTTVIPAKPGERAVRACTDARLVSVTETKPAWHNGRGPLTTVEVGRKLVCTSCETPMIVMKPSLHNGRGPMVPVAIEGTHDCTANGCTTPSTTASID